MVAFALNQTITLDNQPSVSVDAGIPAGRYRFQLIVTDSTGQQSAPAFVQVTIAPFISVPPVVPATPGPSLPT